MLFRLSFTVQSSDTISATLGTQQLQIGLIRGLIGLALVAIYSLIVYRALGSVIIRVDRGDGDPHLHHHLHPGVAHRLPPVARRLSPV